jgi:DNA-binding XRE family transcriptional regulator
VHIKEILARQGITQEELSRRVGASYRHINRLCLGLSEPSYRLAVMIATVLHVRVEELFSVSMRTRPYVR